MYIYIYIYVCISIYRLRTAIKLHGYNTFQCMLIAQNMLLINPISESDMDMPQK